MKRCNLCLRPPTPEGHDPCLGTLPGVDYACCGHGKVPGYILFSNGVSVRFDPKVRIEQLVRPRGVTEDRWQTNMTPNPKYPFPAIIGRTVGDDAYYDPDSYT